MVKTVEKNPPPERGIKLMGEILAMVEAEMQRDHRPSLTNMAEMLIREAVEARRKVREDAA